MLKNRGWSIRRKLFIILGLFLIVFLSFVSWGLYVFRQTETSLYSEEKNLTSSLVFMMEVTSEMSEIKALLLTMILSPLDDPTTQALSDKIIIRLNNLEDRALKYYNFEISSGIGYEENKAEKVLVGINNFSSLIKEFIDKKMNGVESSFLLNDLDKKNQDFFVPLLDFMNEHKNEHVGSLDSFYANTSRASSLMIGIIYASVVLMLILPILLNIIIYYMIIRPIERLHFGVDQVAAGDYGYRMNIRKKDEIGDLAKAFNEMATQLEKNKQDVEVKIAERTAALEKLNSFMVGREVKMLELKKELSLKKEKDEI